MRTTIDLPSDLMHAAKVRAAQHGESLKDLFTRAITHEVGSPGRVHAAGRLTFPLIGRDSEPTVEVTNADIAAALEAEDIERYGR
jgi:plasmid stability protein